MGSVRLTSRTRHASRGSMKSNGFPAVAGYNAKSLILGTLPGKLSLQSCEYYAQPGNVFWGIMGELFGASPDLPYVERTQRLIEHGVALWDVCAGALRPGSLDSAIQHSSVVPNDFVKFFASHPHIDIISFNGAKASELYRRIVLPHLPAAMHNIRRKVLPSTSAAHAGLMFEEKLSRWSVVRGDLSVDAPRA